LRLALCFTSGTDDTYLYRIVDVTIIVTTVTITSGQSNVYISNSNGTSSTTTVMSFFALQFTPA
jgi:hypothetical protein